jgi:hypothetical protein
MIKLKNLNDISDELKNKIPKLENGQEVVFQMLNGHPNNDMDRGEREKNPILYGKTQLATRIKIKDPKNGLVEIGVPERIINGEALSFKPFLAGQFDSIFSGKFSLIGGNVQDEELYEMFWLSPEREGSPCADSAVRPVFKIVNHKEENNKTVTKVDTLRKSLELLQKVQIEKTEITKIANALNWNETDQSAIEVKLSELAKGDPERFLKIANDPDTSKKANIKIALNKGVITMDHATRKVKVGDSEIMTVAKDSMNDHLTAIVNWLNSAKNGTEIYEGILKQLGVDK